MSNLSGLPALALCGVVSFAAGVSAALLLAPYVRRSASSPQPTALTKTSPPPASSAAAAAAAAPSASAAASSSSSIAPDALRKPTAMEIDDAETEEMEGAEDSAAVPADVELKMVACVRNDLGMSKGKIAAQTGHAFLGAFRIAQRLALPREWVKAWLFRAQAKIALKVDSEAEMDAIHTAARSAGLPCCVIEDAGRTEVEPGTRTVLGIGPAPRALIDAITGSNGAFPLRLLA